jgi:MFS family permease
VLCGAVVAALATWFAATAAVPAWIAEGRITPAEAAWLTAAVQLGFVLGTLVFALFSLPDRLPPRLLFAACAADAAIATLLLVLVEPAGWLALLLRGVAGAAMAGVYPVGMKLAAGWAKGDLGLLIGLLVGALTLGSAAPHLAPALLGTPDPARVFIAAGLLALVGAALILLFHEGPLVARRPPFHPSQMFLAWRDRNLRLANAAYLGHMWELYAMWAWIGLYLAQAGLGGGALVFAVVGAGGVGSVVAGWLADRFDRARVTAAIMVASGAAAMLVVPATHAAPALGVAVALVWGLTIVADSAQFSASVVRFAPPDYVGTMLTVQTCLGFLLTVGTIRLTAWLVPHIGWGGAFAVLGLGPWLGAAAMLRLGARTR